MGTTFKHPGKVWNHTAASDISADDVVVMGDVVGVALTDIANGETGSVSVSGVHTLPKIAGVAWNQGDRLDWDASEGAFGKGITGASGDVLLIGVAAAPAASGDTTGEVELIKAGAAE